MGRQLWRNACDGGLTRGHLALRGLGTASEELLLAARGLADSAPATLTVHQSYSPADVAADQKRYGASPVEHLGRVGFLGPNVTLSHVNQLNDAEQETLARSGASVVWAPAASMMWGHANSTGRHVELWRSGVNVALGSDSGNWSNSFDLFRQANLAALIARDTPDHRSYLIAEDVLEMATLGGARALGMESSIGSLEPGKCADIVVHTLARPELLPVTDMVRNLLYSSGSKSVHTVIINGVVVLDGGSFVDIDEERVLFDTNAAVRQMYLRWGYRVAPNNRGERHRLNG
jgi:cytosine/adenosine deaminase-related metal-dependent hydrolase